MSSPPSSSKRPLSFANVVSSVQSSWKSSLKQSQSSTRPSLPTGASDLHLDSTQRVVQDDSFPQIDDKRLVRLFPILNDGSQSEKEAETETQEKRLLVRQALDEMELNWKLDTKPLGERSETNRGTALLVQLLKNIEIKSDNSDGSTSKEIKPGVESEFLSDPDQNQNQDQETGNVNDSRKASSSLVKAQARAFETHDVLRAIDRKDHETLLAIRNSNFDLLLDLAPGGVGGTTSARNTPLGYSISLGKGNESTSIVLIGALSKFVNTLPDIEDDEFDDHVGGGEGQVKRKMARPELDPQTQNRLRKLKVNLKLAIDASILSDQTGLLSSYMQVLVMSEGSSFIHSSIQSVSRSIQSRLSSKTSSHGDLIVNEDPIQVARDLVLRFVTENLRAKSGSSTTSFVNTGSSSSNPSRLEATASRVASVDDYVANSTGDLLMMSFWNLIKLKHSELKPLQDQEDSTKSLSAKINVMELSRDLPSYFFARDDRVTSHFIERVEGIQHLMDLNFGDDQSNLIKKSRMNSVWKKSEMICKKLGSGTRRLNSTERLKVLEGVILS